MLGPLVKLCRGVLAVSLGVMDGSGLSGFLSRVKHAVRGLGEDDVALHEVGSGGRSGGDAPSDQGNTPASAAQTVQCRSPLSAGGSGALIRFSETALKIPGNAHQEAAKMRQRSEPSA